MKETITSISSVLISLTTFIFFIIPSCKKDAEVKTKQDTLIQIDTMYVHDTVQVIQTIPGYILAGQTIGQGIRYTDIINDTLNTSGQYSKDSAFFDVNGDSINDFRFGLKADFAPGFTQTSEDVTAQSISNEVICDSFYVKPLSLNDTAGQYLNFGQGSVIYSYLNYNLSPYTTHENGLWKNVGYKYIGFRLIKNQQIFYGWFGVEWISSTQYVIREYAVTEPF